jgi:hypothetical protein
VGVNAGPRPRNLLVADATIIMYDVDTLSSVVSQIVLLLEKMLLVDVFPEARAESLTAKDTSPSAPVVPWRIRLFGHLLSSRLNSNRILWRRTVHLLHMLSDRVFVQQHKLTAHFASELLLCFQLLFRNS